MKISIITATYNSSDTVKDTLKSVASQSYPNIEHLIIDGLSKDDTLAVCEEYSHIATISSEKDKGIYDAMNRGIGLASGEVIGILNSDDFYEDEKVIEEVAKLFENPDVQAVYGDLIFVDEQDLSKVTRVWKSGVQNKRKWLNGWMPPHPTFFVRKELYEKFGVFNLDLKSAADYELMLRFIYKEDVQVSYLPKVLVRMREGGQSTASLKNRLKANREDAIAWKINGLKKGLFTTYLKPLRKINQFFLSDK